MESPSADAPPASAPPAPRSKLAVAAIVLSLLFVWCLPIAAIGGVLGLVALFRSTGKRGRGLAIAAIVLAGASLPVTSITVAVAIPAFMHYVKRSKAMEARTNVETLYRGVEAYVDAHGELPPDIARAPALVPGVHETAWSAEERARFENIGFAATRSTRYAYSVDVDESTATVIVRALGDLDGDGVLATYELRGHLDPRNGLQRDGRIETTLELE